MGDYFFAEGRERALTMLTDQRPLEALPFEERVLSVRERLSEWLEQSGVRKALDFSQIVVRWELGLRRAPAARTGPDSGANR